MRENEMHKIKQEERATISHSPKGLHSINPKTGNLTRRPAPLMPEQPLFHTALCSWQTGLRVL